MSKKSRLIHWLVGLILVIAVVQVSCARSSEETPTPETAARATETATPEDQPTRKPDATPTKTPAPTPTPMPPLPPQIISRSPARGEEAVVDAPLSVRFDQPMDQKSVEDAFQIEPAVEGDFEWADDQTVLFHPAGTLKRQTRYDVTIKAGARSAVGLGSELPYSFRFQTVGFLEVSQTLPADGSERIDVDTTITIMFNRPVVPLVHTSQMGDLPQPLQLAPAVTGTGEWLNTSIYVFRPDAPLAAGTEYVATVLEGLEDITGGLLMEPFQWRFATQAPRIVWATPDDSSLVGLTEVISVTFNQPMDRASTEAAFDLQTDIGTHPKGTFSWNEESTEMGWSPSSFYQLNAYYTWSLTEEALSAAGGASLENPRTAGFWTVPPPELLFTLPEDGNTRADPYGGMDLYFASPMDTSTIMPNLSIIPEPTSVYTWWDQWDYRFYVGFDKLPSTAYTVTVGAGMADPYGNTLGQETEIHYITDRLDPMAYLNTPGTVGTYNAYTPTVVYAVYRNVDQLDLELSRLDSSDLINLTGSGSWRRWDDYVPPPSRIIRQWTVPVENALDKTIIWKVPVVDEAGNPLQPGVYMITMDAPGLSEWQESRHIMIVSRHNLTVKAAAREALVWATDLVSGQPLANIPISLYDTYGAFLASGMTDSDGVLLTGVLPSDDPGWIYAVSGQPGDEDYTVASSRWADGIGNWDFNLRSEDYSEQQTKIYLYTERPIYRPGQIVYFKGILREPDEARYITPRAQAITVEVYDWDDTLVYQEILPTTDMGTFAGQFSLDEEAITGNYRIVVDPEGARQWFYFQVAEYRKPEFQVTVTPAEDQVIAGDTIQAEVEADYFFGGAVEGAELRWAVYAEDYSFLWDGPGRYAFADFKDWYYYWWDEGSAFGFGELIAEGSGTTDAQGKFTISLPAELADEQGAQRFTLEATVVDVNYQEVSNRTDIIVHPAAWYAGIYADRYVGTAGEEQTVNLIVVDLDQEPVSGAEVTFIALQREWYNVQVQEGDYTRWEWTVEETPIYTETVTVGQDGRASLGFVPPAGGSYRLRAVTTDPAGRQNRASAFLWVSSRTYVSWQVQNNDRIELIADRDSYRPGDVAEILIPSPFRGQVKALVTVERGHFLHQEVITLQSNSEVYRLPITGEHAPTVFVSVVLIKGIDETNELSSFKVGMVQLNISNEQQALDIELVPDAKSYGPGETAAYDVHVTDYQGNPVEAELSLALVDLAVLTLAADQTPPILDAFYGERGLGVDTGVGLTLNVDRLNEQVADMAKGGGGGGGEAAFGIGFEVRSEFPDTAYWEAFLQTDAAGSARLEIPLPDNLTTWRLSAKAVTYDTLVGQASVDIRVTKPLLVRPVAPRFLVVGDQVQLGAVVHNNTDAALEAEVSLAAQGVTLSAQTPTAQTVEIPAGGRVQVTWQVEIEDVDYVGLIFAAAGGGLTDASKPTLATGPDGTIPVYHYTAPDIVGTAGQLLEAGSRTEGILLPPNVDTTQGTLRVEIAPSLAAVMQDGLDYLEHFEYECTEQTVSRFLPNVLSLRAMRGLRLSDPELETKLDTLVSEGLQRLYYQHHYDGGWGWWSTSESNTQVTAWALLGLDKAAEAGFPVDRQVMQDAVDFLRARLGNPADLDSSWQANRHAFVLYVLAERGGITASHLEILYAEKDRLSHYGKAYLALAYGLLEGSSSDRIDTLLADLAGEAILSATGAHWEEAEYDWWNWNTDTRSTAIILDLLARFAPENELAPNIVRWLMVARTAGHWETTQETAWALIGLTDWMIATGELQAEFAFDVGFNGHLLTEGVANRDTIRETTDLEIAVAEMLVDQVNQLAIGRSEGPGRLYYTAHLESHLPVEAVEPIGRGVMVARQYTLASCDPEEEACERLTQAPAGEAVRVKLTVIAPHDLYYVIVEDPLPAGAEAVDQNLLTSSIGDQGEGWQQVDQEYRWGWWGWWWFNQTQVRDEKVVLFAEYLPSGTYEYTYIMRTSLPGEYRVMPTTAYEFYFPEVFGRSDGMLFEITQ